MGMASSQARLLHITARMHQIEYKAQRLEAQKLQLANESDRVYEEYLETLDATKIQYRSIAQDGTTTFRDATFNILENGSLPADVYNGESCAKTFLVKDGTTGTLYLTKAFADYYGFVETDDTITDPGNFDDWMNTNHPEINKVEKMTNDTVEDRTTITSTTLVENQVRNYVPGETTPDTYALSDTSYNLKSVAVNPPSAAGSTASINGSLNVPKKPEESTLGSDVELTGTLDKATITSPNILADRGTNNAKYFAPSIIFSGLPYDADEIDKARFNGSGENAADIIDRIINDPNVTGTATNAILLNDVKCLYIEYLVEKYGLSYGVTDTTIGGASAKTFDNATKAKMNQVQTDYNSRFNDDTFKNLGAFYYHAPADYITEQLNNYIQSNYTDTTSLDNLHNLLKKITSLGYLPGYSDNMYNITSFTGDKKAQLADRVDVRTQLKYGIMKKYPDVDTVEKAETYLSGLNGDDIDSIGTYWNGNDSNSTWSSIIDALYSGSDISAWTQDFATGGRYDGYTITGHKASNGLSIKEPVPANLGSSGELDNLDDILDVVAYDIWSNKYGSSSTTTAEEIKNTLKEKLKNETGIEIKSSYDDSEKERIALFERTYLTDSGFKNAVWNGYVTNSFNAFTSAFANNGEYDTNMEMLPDRITLTSGTTSSTGSIDCDTANNIAAKIAWDCYQQDNSIDPKVLMQKILSSTMNEYNWASLNDAYNSGLSNSDKQALIDHYSENNVAQYISGLLNKYDTEQSDGYTVNQSGTSTLSISGSAGSTGTPTKGEVRIPTLDIIAENFVTAYVKANSGTTEAEQATLKNNFISSYGSLSDDKLAYLNEAICKNPSALTSIKNGSWSTTENKWSNSSEYDIKKDLTDHPNITYGTTSEPRGTGEYDWDTTDPAYQSALSEYNAQKTLAGEKIKIVDNMDPNKNLAESYELVRNLLTANNDGYIIEFDPKTQERTDTSVSTNTWLREVSDEKDLKKAEAKYEADMRQIDKKDRKYDTDLAALETERMACKQEIDTLKTVAKDNVDRTFKLFS